GRWYLVGHDRDRGATRVFRLSRVTGPVRPVGPVGAVTAPEEVDLRAAVDAVARRDRTGTARVRLRSGSGGWLRRAGRPDPADPDVVAVDFADAAQLADEVVGLGAAATVLEPQEVRSTVVARLQAVLAAHPADAHPADGSTGSA